MCPGCLLCLDRITINGGAAVVLLAVVWKGAAVSSVVFEREQIDGYTLHLVDG